MTTAQEIETAPQNESRTLEPDLATGWLVLNEWFVALHQAYITREQLRIYGGPGLDLAAYQRAGWLRQYPLHPERFAPAGELQAAIERLYGAPPEDSPPSSEPSTHPPDSTGAAGVALRPLPNSGAAPAPAASAFPAGRWSAPLQEGGADLAKELADMIAVLRIAADETRMAWLNIAGSEDLGGWKNFNAVQQATAHLRRIASDLFNHLADCEYRLEIVRMNQNRKTK